MRHYLEATDISQTSLFRSSYHRCSIKVFLKISQNSQKNCCASGLRPATLLKKYLAQMFSYEFYKIFKNNFFTELLGTTACLFFMKNTIRVSIFSLENNTFENGNGFGKIEGTEQFLFSEVPSNHLGICLNQTLEDYFSYFWCFLLMFSSDAGVSIWKCLSFRAKHELTHFIIFFGTLKPFCKSFPNPSWLRNAFLILDTVLRFLTLLSQLGFIS